jgi:hypothetical protein
MDIHRDLLCVFFFQYNVYKHRFFIVILFLNFNGFFFFFGCISRIVENIDMDCNEHT